LRFESLFRKLLYVENIQIGGQSLQTYGYVPSIANEKKHPSLPPVINMTPNQLTTSFSTTVLSTAVYSPPQMQGSAPILIPPTHICMLWFMVPDVNIEAIKGNADRPVGFALYNAV